MFSLLCALTKVLANNRDAGDLRRHIDHYDVTVMLRPDYALSVQCICFILIIHYSFTNWPFGAKLLTKTNNGSLQSKPCPHVKSDREISLGLDSGG